MTDDELAKHLYQITQAFNTLAHQCAEAGLTISLQADEHLNQKTGGRSVHLAVLFSKVIMP